MFKKLILFVLIFCLSVSMLFASGFSIYEQGNRATGMAGAFIARANDATALFYNPAGISGLQGFTLSAGATAISAQFAFTGPDIFDAQFYTKAKPENFYPFHIYGTYRISKTLSAGIGLFSPFGLASSWGSAAHPWVGRQLATQTELQSLFINPSLAYRISERLSVAAGISLVWSKVKLGKSVFFTPRSIFGESSLTAQANGFAFNLGLQYTPFEGLHLGMVYRSNTLLEFKDGDATFTFPDQGNDTLNQEISTYFPQKTKGSANITLPDMAGIGLAYDFTKNMSFEFDIVRMGWHSYNKLRITFKDPIAGKRNSTSIRNYKDAYSLRFGLEYRVMPWLTVRSGYFWDQHAVPEAYVEPSLPEGDRHNYTLGFTYQRQNFTLDAAFQSLLQNDRKISHSVNNFNGKYTGLATLFGLTLGYTF